jgi:predicted transcriptional regulator
MKIVEKGWVKRNFDGSISYGGFTFDTEGKPIDMEEMTQLMEDILEEQEDEIQKHLANV